MRGKGTSAMEASCSRLEVNSSDASNEIRVGDQMEQGNDAAILAAEESLNRVVISHGPCSEQTRQVATRLVLAYNHFAMKKLSENNIKGSLRLLQRAMLLTSQDQPFFGNARLQARALTLNNLGCLMKKWGKPREGVKFLARALRIEAEIPGSADNPAGTHVNMSAALSTLGFHRAAAAHAGHAIGLASQAMTKQEKESSSVTTEKDSITTGEGQNGDVAPGSVEEGGKASIGVGAVGDGVDVDCGGGGGSGGGGGGGGGMADVRTARFGEAPDNSRDVPPSDVRTKDGETLDSVQADDGRSPETSSLSSVSDASREISGQEESSDRPANPGHSVDHHRVSSESTNSVEESTGSVEKRAASPSAAGGLLAIAYFNLGVEREYLGQLEAARSSYEDARVIAGQHLGPESAVAKAIEVALEKFSTAVAAAACYSSKRAALRAQTAVSSFPSIGKLQFGQRTPDGVSSFGSGRTSPRRRVQRQQHDGETTFETSARDRLHRAYSNPRPHPAPSCTSDSWARLGLGPPLPRSPSTASGPEPGGPQRAGRWTKTDAPAVRPVKAPRFGRGGRSNEGCDDDALRWRALACAEWQCSPRDALHAQQTAYAVPAPK